MTLIPISSFAATIFQDNFEHNSFAPYAEATASNGTITTSSDVAHSGTYSLKCALTSGGGSVYVLKQMLFGTRIRCRFWVYLTSTLVNNINSSSGDIVLMAGYDSGYTTTTMIMQLQPSIMQLFANDWEAGVQTSLPSADTWHCIEFDIYFNSSTGYMYLWVDGVLADSDTGVNTGDLTVLNINFEAGDWSNITGTLYIDDIVIDDSRYIGTGFKVSQDGAVGSLYHN